MRHGTYGQVPERENSSKWSCPYMDHTGVPTCFGGREGGCRFSHDGGLKFLEGWTLIDEPDNLYIQTQTFNRFNPDDGGTL
eukprot:8096488-Karenia_brevis.AAC.1